MEENKTIELEEMRTQLNLLKQALDKEQITNERLIIASMKSKMSWIKKYVICEVLVLPFILIIFGNMYCRYNLSWWSFIYITVLTIIDIFFDYWVNVREISARDYESYNLLQTAEKLAKMKKYRAWQTVVGFVLLFIWMVWIGISLYMQLDKPMSGVMTSGIVGGVIGGVIGFYAAYKTFSKMQKTNDEVISQIQEFVQEK